MNTENNFLSLGSDEVTKAIDALRTALNNNGYIKSVQIDYADRTYPVTITYQVYKGI